MAIILNLQSFPWKFPQPQPHPITSRFCSCSQDMCNYHAWVCAANFFGSWQLAHPTHQRGRSALCYWDQNLNVWFETRARRRDAEFTFTLYVPELSARFNFMTEKSLRRFRENEVCETLNLIKLSQGNNYYQCPKEWILVAVEELSEGAWKWTLGIFYNPKSMFERPLFLFWVFECLMSRSAHKLTKKSPALNCIQMARVCQLRRRNQAKGKWMVKLAG